MMKLGNKVYLSMTKRCLSFLSEKQFDLILDIEVGNGALTKRNIKRRPSIDAQYRLVAGQVIT